jgi:hypothetical protein
MMSSSSPVLGPLAFIILPIVVFCHVQYQLLQRNHYTATRATGSICSQSGIPWLEIGAISVSNCKQNSSESVGHARNAGVLHMSLTSSVKAIVCSFVVHCQISTVL